MAHGTPHNRRCCWLPDTAAAGDATLAQATTLGCGYRPIWHPRKWSSYPSPARPPTRRPSWRPPKASSTRLRRLVRHTRPSPPARRQSTPLIALVAAVCRLARGAGRHRAEDARLQVQLLGDEGRPGTGVPPAAPLRPMLSPSGAVADAVVSLRVAGAHRGRPQGCSQQQRGGGAAGRAWQGGQGVWGALADGGCTSSRELHHTLAAP
eukprot:scaffold1076_cov342-Prasinococcus_capsulatus_cf.AAC.4